MQCSCEYEDVLISVLAIILTIPSDSIPLYLVDYRLLPNYSDTLIEMPKLILIDIKCAFTKTVLISVLAIILTQDLVIVYHYTKNI